MMDNNLNQLEFLHFTNKHNQKENKNTTKEVSTKH